MIDDPIPEAAIEAGQQAYEAAMDDCVLSMTDPPPGFAMKAALAAAMPHLVGPWAEVAHRAWHALEDSCEFENGGANIGQSSFDALTKSLEEITGEYGDIHDFMPLPTPPKPEGGGE